ncbi:hypothetical protein BE20_18490, partial [Sorangium cellulosum]
LVAAAAGERVSVSADEGRSFTAAVVAPGKRVRAVLVRPDGVLAAVVEGRRTRSSRELVVEATETPAGPAEERRVGPAGR